jgi:hypothetical protein
MKMLVLLCALVSIVCAGDSLKLRRVSLNGRLQDGGLVGQVRADVTYEMKDGSNPNVTTSYFRQKLDHFDSNNNATWLQYYWQNTGNYRPGGPIFILIGGEAPTSQDWIDDCAGTTSNRFPIIAVCFSTRPDDIPQVSKILRCNGFPV